MSRMRVLMIEAELADAAMLQQMIGGFLEPVASQPVAIEPAAHPVPQLAAAPEPAKPKVGRPKAKPAPGGGPPKAAAPARVAPAEDGSTRTIIIEALRKKPMISGEVIAATGLSKSQVYSMLNILRNEGVVESRKDDDSIYPKQYLVKV